MDTRKTITLNIAGLVQQSPAAGEFYQEYSTTTSHTVKRGLVDRIVRAGSLMEQCGLTSVVALLDNANFMDSSLDEKREMLLKALELSGIASTSPVNTTKRPRVAKKQEVDSSVANTDAPANSDDDGQKSDTDDQAQSEKEEAAPKRTGAGKMFGGFRNPTPE